MKLPWTSEMLCLTHSPGDWCKPGEQYTTSDGQLWRISRIRALPRTALLNGGHASCWEVRGKRIKQHPLYGTRCNACGESRKHAPDCRAVAAHRNAPRPRPHHAESRRAREGGHTSAEPRQPMTPNAKHNYCSPNTEGRSTDDP